MREILKRIRFNNGGNLVIHEISTDQKYDERRNENIEGLSENEMIALNPYSSSLTGI